MIRTSPWVKATLVLIPGILFILVAYLFQYYGSSRAKSFDFIIGYLAISVLATMVLIVAIASRYGEKCGFIMVFYLIMTAVICFTLYYYGFLTGDIIVLFAVHNILAVAAMFFG